MGAVGGSGAFLEKLTFAAQPPAEVRGDEVRFGPAYSQDELGGASSIRPCRTPKECALAGAEGESLAPE